MPLTAYINFCFKNYLRQHRYLRDLIAIVVFTIFFGGFLTSNQLEEDIWLVFMVFALLLNLLTAPSLFFLEKGNTLYFLLGKPHGRRQVFLSKIMLIVLVDLFWVFSFAVLYGLRFLSPTYFVLLPLRLLLTALVLLLSTLFLSLAYTYRPQLSWLIFLLLVLGNIINKAPLFPIKSLVETIKLLIFLIPPFFELNSLAISLDFSGWQLAFLGIALLQIALLLIISGRHMLRKDLL